MLRLPPCTCEPELLHKHARVNHMLCVLIMSWLMSNVRAQAQLAARNAVDPPTREAEPGVHPAPDAPPPANGDATEDAVHPLHHTMSCLQRC